jgi:hypothetical protein
VSGGGRVIRLNAESVNEESAPRVAVTDSVMENGALVGPGPVTVALELEVAGPMLPAGVPDPNSVLLLSI